MPYGSVNKSGCGVRKGNCQIRLDVFLEAADPRYSDRYLEVEPGVWQNTPFHSHFIYLPATFTEDDIKVAIATHLPNFYKAFQDGWDATDGGMRHGWATETRIKPKDYSTTDTAAKYNARLAACQDAIDALVPFDYKPGVTSEGKTYPATEIDIGPGAIDRTAALGLGGYTGIDMTNSANDTGIIDTFEVWANTQLSNVKFGTFYGSGSSWTNRDGETIGTVTAGSKQTFTGLNIDVVTGDFAGIYGSAGSIEEATLASNRRYKAGDQFGTGTQTYSTDNYIVSIYGTGETSDGTDGTPHLSGEVAAKLIAGKMI